MMEKINRIVSDLFMRISVALLIVMAIPTIAYISIWVFMALAALGLVPLS